MLSLFENLRAINDPDLLLAKEPFIDKGSIFHVFWKDLNGVYLGANDTQAKTYTLAKAAELRGGTDYDFLSIDSAEFLQNNDQKVTRNGLARVFIEPVITADGLKRTAFSHKKLLLSKNKKVLGSLGFAFLLEDNDALDLTFLLGVSEQKRFSFTREKKLSRRQMDCLVFLIKGKTFKQIASELNLSARTIEHYIQILKTKFSVYSRSELIAKALEFSEVREKI